MPSLPHLLCRGPALPAEVRAGGLRALASGQVPEVEDDVAHGARRHPLLPQSRTELGVAPLVQTNPAGLLRSQVSLQVPKIKEFRHRHTHIHMIMEPLFFVSIPPSLRSEMALLKRKKPAP